MIPENGQEFPLEVLIETTDNNLDLKKSETSLKFPYLKKKSHKTKKSKKKCKFCSKNVAHEKCCYSNKIIKTKHKSSSAKKRELQDSLINLDTVNTNFKKISQCPNTKLWTCIECKFETDDAEKLQKHILTHQLMDKNNLICVICGYVNFCRRTRNRHMLTHYDIKPFQCHLCSYKCSRSDNLFKHKRNVHKIDI